MPFEQAIPRNFTTGDVKVYAPAKSGVYGISNAREWIYIGVTGNIRSALLTHLQEAGTSLMKRLPTGFVFEVCDDAQHQRRQDRLVLEYEPTCNRRLARYL
jgi:hypothetical protein